MRSVDQHQDQRPASDQRSQHDQDLVPAQPSRLDQLGDLHAGLLRGARAEFVEQLLLALQCDGDGRVETGSAEMAHRSRQQVGGHDPYDRSAARSGPATSAAEAMAPARSWSSRKSVAFEIPLRKSTMVAVP